MRRIGGGAGYDLDSIVTLARPAKRASPPWWRTSAPAGDLLAKLPAPTGTPCGAATAWSPPRDLRRPRRPCPRWTPSAPSSTSWPSTSPPGLTVRRLPLLTVPVALLQDRAGLTHSGFLITWNNVVVETRDKDDPRRGLRLV